MIGLKLGCNFFRKSSLVMVCLGQFALGIVTSGLCTLRLITLGLFKVRTLNLKPNVRISFVLRWSNIWRFFLSPFF